MPAPASLPRTFRKSIAAFVILFAKTLLLLAIPVGVAVAADSSGVQLAFGILAALILVRQTYRFLVLRSTRWVVAEDGVTMRSGFLPWKRWTFHVPYEAMFEAFYGHSFFGHFLNYGRCTIRRSEGTTSTLSQPHMQDAKTLVGIVNSKIAAMRAAKPAPSVAVQVNQYDSLADLVRLRANGELTAEEFDTMKARIVGGSPAA